jgi:cell division septal protein FtsQ
VTLDGDDVVRRLEALPTVVSAAYDRDFPHSLVVTVVPERPVGVVRQGADAWLVSARGRVMARLEPGLEPRLPRLWVDRSVSIALGDLLDGDPALLSGPLDVLARSPLAGRVLTARLDEGRLVLVLRSGLELQLGKPAAVALKLAVASRVLAQTGSSGGRGSYLDLSVPDRPVGHLNSQPAE